MRKVFACWFLTWPVRRLLGARVRLLWGRRRRQAVQRPEFRPFLVHLEDKTVPGSTLAGALAAEWVIPERGEALAGPGLLVQTAGEMRLAEEHTGERHGSAEPGVPAGGDRRLEKAIGGEGDRPAADTAGPARRGEDEELNRTVNSWDGASQGHQRPAEHGGQGDGRDPATTAGGTAASEPATHAPATGSGETPTGKTAGRLPGRGCWSPAAPARTRADRSARVPRRSTRSRQAIRRITVTTRSGGTPPPRVDTAGPGCTSHRCL